MDFSDVYRRYSDDIRVTALSQRVPGLDYDDVVSEMTACLWKAWTTFDPHKGTTFGAYWWSTWLNRRTNITVAAYRQKRPKTVLAGEYIPEGRYLMDLLPHPPSGSTRKARKVWVLLAAGMKPSEVMEEVGMSRRTYYDLIRSWRNDEVKGLLSSL